MSIDFKSKDSSRLCLKWVLILFLFCLLPRTDAFALELYEDKSVSVSLDTTLSWGMKFRVQDRDDDLIGIAQGGDAVSSNIDDGNLNFDKGIAGNVFKITSEMEIESDNWGGFFRGSAFYDWELMQNDRERTDLTDKAEDEAGRKAEILDAYIWGSHDIGSMPATLRVGRQVINWGESLFIGNSINTLNPIDVAKIRVPGAELKEALMPLASIYGSIGLTDNLNLEGVYLLEWDKYTLDPLGTYFSTSDTASPGGFKLLPGYGMVPDNGNASVVDTSMAVPRSEDKEADDQGQFGIALRYFVESLDTDLSFYYLNYHSQTPVLNLKNASLNGVMAAAGGDMNAFWETVNFETEYIEDVSLLGMAFSTSLWDSAVQGEISHRMDAPLQIDGSEMFFAVLGQLNPFFADNNQIGDYSGTFDEKIKGYILRDVTQVQVSMIKNLGRWGGMDTWNVLGEIGYTHVHNMPDKSDLRISAPGVQASGNEVIGPVAHPHADVVDDDHFADADSTGYRLMLSTKLNDAFWDVNLLPRIAWSHDVAGNAPSSLGTFQEGRKAITLGIGAEYHTRWLVDVSYTNYFGAGSYNSINDRDFLAFNIKYQF